MQKTEIDLKIIYVRNIRIIGSTLRSRHLGTAREVITRMLKHLAADGVIEVTRKGIVIKDKKKLQNLAY